jgi:MoaD family protein
MPVIKLYANLRKLVGSKELSVSGETLQAALDDLIQQHSSLEDALLVNGQLRPHVIVTVNGQNLISLDTPLKPSDIIAVFPPIAGG